MSLYRLNPEPVRDVRRCTTCCERKSVSDFPSDGARCSDCCIAQDRCPYCENKRASWASMCTECAKKPHPQGERRIKSSARKS